MTDQNVVIDLSVTGDAQAAAALERVGRRGAAGLGQVEQGARRASSALDQWTRRATGGNISRFGLLAQQAGYQVQDFAVQVTHGTSAVVAFGQQAPQLLGYFGAFGATAGVAVALAAAFANGLLGMGGASETAAEMLDRANDAIERTRDSATVNIKSVAAMVEAYGALDEQLIALIQRQTTYNLLAAKGDTAAAVGAAARGAPDVFGGSLTALGGQIGALSGEAPDAQAQQTLRLYGLADAAANARDFEAQAAAVGALALAIDDVTDETARAELAPFVKDLNAALFAIRALDEAEREAAEASALLARPIAELRAEIEALADLPGKPGGGGGSAGGRVRAALESLEAPPAPPRNPNRVYGTALGDAYSWYQPQADMWAQLEDATASFGDAATRSLDQVLGRLESIEDAGQSVIALFAQIGARMFVEGLVQPAISAGSGWLLGTLRQAISPTAPGAMGAPPARPFAFGGDAIVPGYGGHDSVTAVMKVSPGERISVRRRGEGPASVVLHYHAAPGSGTGEARRAAGVLEAQVALLARRGARNQ